MAYTVHSRRDRYTHHNTWHPSRVFVITACCRCCWCCCWWWWCYSVSQSVCR